MGDDELTPADLAAFAATRGSVRKERKRRGGSAANPASDPAAGDPRAWLTDQLGLGDARAVQEVAVFGHGPNAMVHIALADGSALRFEHFSDLTKPAQLATNLVTQTGVYKPQPFKGPDAMQIAAVVYQLARHHAEHDDLAAAAEWGRDYLRVAQAENVILDHQAERFRAFGILAGTHPASSAGENRSAYALAANSVVLVDSVSGVRFVRTGWFQAYVKREVGGVFSPERLATLMVAVGWTRTGKEGRIKATNSSDGRVFSFNFYRVAPEWGDASAAAERDYSHARGDADADGGQGPA